MPTNGEGQTPPPPPLAQPQRKWAEISFPADPLVGGLKWMTVVTPAQAQATMQAAATSKRPPQTPAADPHAHPLSPGWNIVGKKKRGRGLTSPQPGGRRGRRKVDLGNMQSVAVSTRDPLPSLSTIATHKTGGAGLRSIGPPMANPFAMSQTSNSVTPTPRPTATPPSLQIVRAQPSPHLTDSDYLNLEDVPNMDIAGAPLAGDMIIDPVPHAVLSRSGSDAAPSGAEPAPSLNIPFHMFGQRGGNPFHHQFAIQTPRVQHDVFSPNPAALQPETSPMQPPPGSFAERLGPRRIWAPQASAIATLRSGPLMAPRSAGLRVLDAPGLSPAPANRTALISMDSARMVDDGSQNDGQESPELMPGLHDVPRYGSAFAEQVGDDFGRLTSSRAQSVVGFPLHSTPPPVNPLTGRITKVGQQYRQQSVPNRFAEPQALRFTIDPRMIKPPEGYPRIRYSDPDCLVAGQDEAYIEELKDRERSGYVLGFRIPDVIGVPPDNFTRGVRRRVEYTVADYTGESTHSVVPPRPSRNRRPGDPISSLWFIRDMSQRAARIMLEVGAVSNPDVTFTIHNLTVAADVVVILGGLITTSTYQIEQMIVETFNSPGVRAIIGQHVSTHPSLRELDEELAVEFILETLEVQVDFLGDTPIAKVYIQSPSGTKDGWRRFRAAIQTVHFENGYNPLAVPRTYECDICGGSDHPEQLCKYPTLTGWKGRIPQPVAPQGDVLPAGNELVFNPRKANEGRSGAGQKKTGGGRFNQNFGAQMGPPYGSGGHAGPSNNRGGGGSGGNGYGGHGPRPY